MVPERQASTRVASMNALIRFVGWCIPLLGAKA